MLNETLFQEISLHKKQILVVTKYWDKEKTFDILSEVEKNYSDIFFGLWENRIEHIQQKDLPRGKAHFIGNIQSRKIPEIVKYCSTIHSLCNIKHAEKIEKLGEKTSAFIQIKLDANKNIGIREWELWEFLEAVKDFKYLKIIGISWMGALDKDDKEKREEFQKLLSLKEKYIPHGKISAGTSRDYQIALEEWIDIVRIWEKSIS